MGTVSATLLVLLLLFLSTPLTLFKEMQKWSSKRLKTSVAGDLVFSALKTSVAMGYLAPEYVTTGKFTEKTDIFAFGVIILDILSGKLMLTNSLRLAHAYKLSKTCS